MPMDTIGQLNLQVAEQQAKGIEGNIEGRRELARGIQGGVEAGLGGAQNALQYELESARRREADAFLKNGAQEVVNYASSMGLDPTLYKKLVANVKDPNDFIPLFKTAKQAGEKKKEDANVLNFVTQLEALSGVSDDNEFNAMFNKFNSKIIGTENEQKRMRDALKSAKDTRDATVKSKSGKPGDATKGIINLRDKFSKESEDINKVLRATSVLRTAFEDGAYIDEKGNVNRVGSDQALIMTFNKILDPTSVVRESEFNRTPDAAGAMNRAQGWFKKLIEGGSGLTEIGRKAIFKMSELISQGSLIDKFVKIQEFERLAEIENVDSGNIDLVFPGFSSYKEQYEEFKSLGKEEFVNKIVKELNESLDQAKSEVIEGGAKDTSKQKETTTKKPNRRVATSIEEF